VTGPDDFFAGIPFAVPAAEQRSLDRLTGDERTAIESYALNGFDRVNRALRGYLSMNPAIQTQVDQIRSGLRKYRLETEVRVTREVSGHVLSVTDAASAEATVGRVFDELGFMSTTMAEQPASSSAHLEPLTLDLLVPASTPALALGELTEVPLEREMLIIDSCRYQIVAARYDQTASRWRLFGLIEPEPGA
jgi:ADP-ribosyltransferase exoenzyme